MKKIIGSGLACLMLLNPILDTVHAVKLDGQKNSKESTSVSTLAKYLLGGVLLVGGIAATAGFIYANCKGSVGLQVGRVKPNLGELPPFEREKPNPTIMQEQYKLNLRSEVSTRYTLTTVFYDNDRELSKFMAEGLEYEFRNVNSNDSVIGFNEKIPNPLKTYGMNTVHRSNTTKIITKLIPIDSRKLKTLSPPEYTKLQALLKKCMAGIILFDYSDPRLEIFQEFWASRDCKTFLEHDFTFNHVFKLMGSVNWGNFVGVYTYNASKLTKAQWEKQYSNLENYMGSLERFFEVDNRWDTRCQTEKVENAFRTIAESGTGQMGSSSILIKNESLAKEYLRENAGVNII